MKTVIASDCAFVALAATDHLNISCSACAKQERMLMTHAAAIWPPAAPARRIGTNTNLPMSSCSTQTNQVFFSTGARDANSGVACLPCAQWAAATIRLPIPKRSHQSINHPSAKNIASNLKGSSQTRVHHRRVTYARKRLSFQLQNVVIR